MSQRSFEVFTGNDKMRVVMREPLAHPRNRVALAIMIGDAIHPDDAQKNKADYACHVRDPHAKLLYFEQINGTWSVVPVSQHGREPYACLAEINARMLFTASHCETDTEQLDIVRRAEVVINGDLVLVG